MIGVAALSLIMCAAVVSGCGGSGTGDEHYRGVVTAAAEGPMRSDQVLVGIGDDRYLPPPYRTVAEGSQVTADCHGPRGGPIRGVTVTTKDGWKVQLTHGSQTITAENAQIKSENGQIKVPPGQITTDPGSIDASRSGNRSELEITGKTSVYTSGINWDVPARGHIEVQIDEERPPAVWGESPEFKMYMHINCGGDPAAITSSMTTAPPST